MNGRNWLALAMLAPGSRTSSSNAVTPLPDRNGGEAREFQLNMDGQQVSNEIGTGDQPRYSQDAIAEFQFLTNRFDATQGRTSGVQVNVITKSGTNQLSGLFRTQLPPQPLQRGGAGPPPRPADQQPAVQCRRRRPDRPRQAALLRQLRIRARAAEQHLEHAVPGLQRRIARRQDHQAEQRARRLSALERRSG